MDLPESTEENNVDYTFLYIIYGFLALLGFCFLFSLGKAIYHYYKERKQRNAEVTENSINTECHSMSDEPLVLDKQIENEATETDRLRDQLDKLRKLLNRLNAMGTFSRDTIGDLSAQSAPYINNSAAASSDFSAFWSSIDFDEFDDSTINEGILRKTPTEISVSPSLSDFSVDTPGVHFDKAHLKNIATSSKENILNPSALNRQTNPSDTIFQILSILDSIVQNRNNSGQLQNNAPKNKQNFDKSKNFQALSQSKHSVESYTPQKQPITSSSTVSINEMLPPTYESLNSQTIISTSKYTNSENLNTEPKAVDNGLELKSNLLRQLSQFMDSQYKMSSIVSIESQISKGMSVVSIRSSDMNRFYDTKFSASLKSLDTEQISDSRSVSVYIDPIKCLSTQIKAISESLAVSKEPHSFVTGNAINVTSKVPVSKISSCTIDIEVINRSQSLSDLLDNKFPNFSVQLDTNTQSEDNKLEASHLSFYEKPLPVITISEPPQSSEINSQENNEMLEDENAKQKNIALQINNNKFRTISSKSLHTPVFYDVPMKSSISESGIQQLHWGTHSPNLSSSGSDQFLTPVICGHSELEKTEWKSPVEPDIYLLSNLTPHNESAVVSRKSFMWFTPPSPDEISDKVVKVNGISNT